MILTGGAHPAFAFRWGALVLFDATPEARAALLAQLAPRIANPLAVPLAENAWLSTGAERDEISDTGEIRLMDLSTPRLGILADALAKSAALSHQEMALDRTLDGMEPVVTRLRERGRLGFLSRGLMRAIGAALAARGRANARIQAGDKPDLLWEHPGLERLHQRLSDEFELPARCAALERKLVMVGEIMQTLLSLIQGQRSLMLEIAVASFILIEVIATLYGLVAR
ncbi:RMD1 family protein [Sediminicoccus sp. KRV36]|uniref:RMD1 family protein n=1 Tax=Sediminicoccus sp. KRV36 TaxID=3133721 RepID=UPI00200DB8FF|nr:RMD1 family protein [Sediminicoccus rosea]UPY37901.1 RMD1 family protein [Sediminicoccus rosea]